MTARDRERFGPIDICLNDGRSATIRPLMTSDRVALGEFYESVPREDCRFYLPYPLTREQAVLNASRADSLTEVVVVLETPERAIAGYAWYRWQGPDDRASGFGIRIRRGWQEAGAGRALMSRLLEIAREVGPPVMVLTVQKANQRAFRLYSSMGFKVVREHMRAANPEYGFEAEPECFMEHSTR